MISAGYSCCHLPYLHHWKHHD